MEYQALARAYRKFIDDPRRPLFALIIVAICVRILMTLGTNGILWPDSRAYYRSAALMAKFGNFHWHEIYRTPFYPIFMAPFLWLFDQKEFAGFLIITAQRALGVVSMLLLYKVTRKHFGAGIAFYASLLFSIHTVQLYYETTVHTEPLFTFFLLLIIYLADRFFEYPTLRQAALLGFLCGLLTLTRPLGQFVLLVILAVFVLREKFSLRWWKTAGISLTVFVAVLLPWMFTNKVYYKFFGVSQDLGLNLFHRVIDVEKIPPSETSVYPRVKRAWDSARTQRAITYFSVYHTLLKERMRRVKADRMMAAFALETLTQDSGKYYGAYLKNVSVTFLRFFFQTRNSVQFCGDSAGPYLCTKNTLGQNEKAFSNNAAGISSTGRSAVQMYFKMLGFPMAAFSFFALIGFAATARSWRRASPTALLMVTVTLYFAALTAIFNIPEDRFRLPVDPILFVFACFTLSSVLSYSSKWVALRWRPAGVTG